MVINNNIEIEKDILPDDKMLRMVGTTTIGWSLTLAIGEEGFRMIFAVFLHYLVPSVRQWLALSVAALLVDPVHRLQCGETL